jgi:lipoic acid synthetase
MSERPRLPGWLKKRLPSGPEAAQTRRLINRLGLATVCHSAKCPNIWECYSRKVATFMILGDTCTRACRFCGVTGGTPRPLDADEPRRVAEAVARLGLRHAVVTSVTRDDLPDGGAAHFVATIEAIRAANPDATVEVLVPDFLGRADAIHLVVEAGPDVFNHNIETVPRLYPAVRPGADYTRSLDVLSSARALRPAMLTKSGLMVGLGETRAEVEAVLADLRGAGVDVVTIGQYLQPTKQHLPVAEFVPPDVFRELEARAEALGFTAALCGPFVRSSYNAAEALARGTQRTGAPQLGADAR